MLAFATKVSIVLAILVGSFFQTGCHRNLPNGFLHIRAPSEGSYEIYRVASEQPLQFISEQIGVFNQNIHLQPGNYLVLADCSYQNVIIRPDKTETLVAHEARFIPPIEPSSEDLLWIQCDRYAKTKTRQNLENQFTLTVLNGSHEILVGMVPFVLNWEGDEFKKHPRTFNYELAAVKLSAFDGMDPKTSYFVSPAQGHLSITRNQAFGNWQFLLPGSYHLQVNGTQMTVSLDKGETHIVEPSFIKVSVAPSVSLELSSSLLGTPLYVELNNGHWLDLNRTYPLLPGPATLKLNGSQREYHVELESGQLLEKETRSLTVSFDCAPWQWSCLGNHKIYLYNSDKPYHFSEGVSDVPILFFEEEVWVSIQGSRDIRYQLKTGQRDFHLKVGQVTFKPKYIHRPNQITDLTRVEAIKDPFTGHTLDLPSDRDVTIPLVAGAYHLAQYTSLYGNEYERRSSKRWFLVKPFQSIEIDYQVIVAENKLKALRENLQKHRKRNPKAKQIAIRRFDAFIPITIN